MKKLTNITTNYTLLFLAAATFFVAGLILQLVVSTNLAVKSKDLAYYDKRKHYLTKEVSELELSASKYMSIAYIEERARNLGYVDYNYQVLTIAAAPATAVVPSL